MQLTRQTFQLIAEAVQDFVHNDPGVTLELAEHFADRLADTNPNFDRDRFIDVATGKRER